MVDKVQVLEAVNKLRLVLELEPLADLAKGVRLGCESCPIANSISSVFQWSVGTDEIVTPYRLNGEISFLIEKAWGGQVNLCSHIISEAQRYENPQVIREFIAEFDKGNWPEYEEELELKE